MQDGGAGIPQKRQWRWPMTRMARTAFLYGSGWSPEEIASDIFIQSNDVSVRRALRRAGVYGGPTPPGRYKIDLARRHIEPLQIAAGRRHVSVEALMRRLVEQCAEEPSLIDNILDDGG